MPTLTIEQLVQYVEELPALPNVAMQVLKLADDPNASARSVAESISVDVALTTRVLRIANSAYYGMTRKISTVNEAVILLGMQSLRSLALAAATYDTLKKELPGYSMSAGDLWKHSISCGITSQIVAKRTGKVRAEEAFVAGLLHDVGKVILNVYVGSQFDTILALVDLDEMPFYEAERSVLGFDHAEVGGRVGDKWNLPANLCAAIRGHHRLSDGAEDPTLAAAVHVANQLCTAESSGTPIDLSKLPIDPDAMGILGLTEFDLDPIMREMVVAVEKAQGIFDVRRAA